MFVFPYNISQTHIFFSLTQPSYPLPFLGTEFGFAQTRWNYCVFSGLRREPCIHSQGAQFSTWLGSRELLLSSETFDGSSVPVAIETEFVFPYNISQTARLFFSLIRPSYPLPFLGTESGFAQTRWNYCVFSGLSREPCIHSQAAQFSTWLGSRELFLSNGTSDGSSAPVARDCSLMLDFPLVDLSF